MSVAVTASLALRGGTPVRPPERTWPAWPVFGQAERTALNEVLESGAWWYGERVAAFERAFAAFQDAAHCVSCTSGTTALELCMMALGLGPGDEVLVPAYTFIATATAVARTGATPVFVDVDERWCLDPDRAEAAITPRTRAIVPVHFGSSVADMDRINALAERHGLVVLEDACHSWGSRWRGKGTGALGRAGVFSFQMSKNITAGEGGAILTDDESFAARCRSISNCGRGLGGVWYEHTVLGTNARLTEFAAALLSAQLTRLEEQTLQRERNAAILNAELGAVEGLTPQPGDPRITRRAYHLYGLRVDPARFGCSRARLLEAAAAEGLPMGPGYSLPLYRQPVFAAMPAHECPITEDLCYRSGMWFKHALLLGSDDDMHDIVTILRKVKEHASELAD